MTKVDIVLIKPGSQKQLYGELSMSGLTGLEPPLWAAILAGYLRGLGYSVLLYDAELENWSYEETAEKIKSANPLLAAVVASGTNPSASTMNMTGAGKIVSILRELAPDIKTLLAGLHPSALPERTLTEEAVDFVCQGEGFYTIPKLLDALKNKAGSYSIEGLWYKKNNEVISNPRPPLLDNLDSLPRPAWDLLPMKRYRAHNWHCFGNLDARSPYAILYTSLGCPFRCSFCCINALFGENKIRYRGIDKVVEELDFLVNTYGVRNIKIVDEMFAMGEKRVVELCERIADKGYDLNIWAYARVNTVTEKMLASMREAGIRWICYGFESGSERVIKDASKGYSLELAGKAAQMTHDSDIHILGNYMVGLPEDDQGSMDETLKLMLDINSEWVNIYCAMAYPGSRLYDMAIKKGWQLPDLWEGYSQYSYQTLPLPTKYLSAGEVLSFRDHAFQEYFNNPGYLSMIDKKFGHETTLHIKDMLSKKLKRKYASA